MFTSRSSSRPRKERPPCDGDGGRRAAILRSAVALGMCTVAACALFWPGMVLGAARTTTEADAATPVEQTPVTEEVVPAATDATRVEASRQTGGVSAGELLVRLPWGDGDAAVGLEAPTEGLTRGPEAVAVAPDGRVAILDSVNGRLVILDADGVFRRTIPVELSQPRFLAVTDQRLYVLDCDADRRLLSVDWSGAAQTLSELPALDDVVTGLFATDTGACIEIAHGEVSLISEPATPAASSKGDGRSNTPGKAVLRPLGGRPVGTELGLVARVAFAPGRAIQIRTFTVDRDSLKAGPAKESSPSLFGGLTVDHLVSVDGDGHGGLIVGGRLLTTGESGAGSAALVVTRVATSPDAGGGTALGPAAAAGEASTASLLLADCPFAFLGQPYLVAPDGRIIQPVADESGYSLMVHSFTPDGEVAP